MQDEFSPAVSEPFGSSGFAGLRVLVIEDEGPVAMLIEDMLEELGCLIAGSAASVREAMELVRQGGFDFALLDLNLAGERAFPVAEALQGLGVPFAFASGYGALGVGERWATVPVVQKPFQRRDLARILTQNARR